MSVKQASFGRSRPRHDKESRQPKTTGSSFSSDVDVRLQECGANLTRTTSEGARGGVEVDGRMSSVTDPGVTATRSKADTLHKDGSAWLRRWDKRQQVEMEWRFEHGELPPGRDDKTRATRPAGKVTLIPRSVPKVKRVEPADEQSAPGIPPQWRTSASPAHKGNETNEHEGDMHRNFEPKYAVPKHSIADKSPVIPIRNDSVRTCIEQATSPIPDLRLRQDEAQWSDKYDRRHNMHLQSTAAFDSQNRSKTSPITAPKRCDPPPVPPTSPVSPLDESFIVVNTTVLQQPGYLGGDTTTEVLKIAPNTPDWHFHRALDRLEGRQIGPRTPSSRSEVIPDSPTLKGLGIQGLSSGIVKPDTSSETSSDLSLLRGEQATFKHMAMMAAMQAAIENGHHEDEDGYTTSKVRPDSPVECTTVPGSPDGYVSRKRLLVKPSPEHGKIVPERNSTFLMQVQECARQEQALRASTPSHLQLAHPALRDHDHVRDQDCKLDASNDKKAPILENLHLRKQVVENLQYSTRQRLIDRRLKGKSTGGVTPLQQQKSQQPQTKSELELEPDSGSPCKRISSASTILSAVQSPFLPFTHRSSEGDLRTC